MLDEKIITERILEHIQIPLKYNRKNQYYRPVDRDEIRNIIFLDVNGFLTQSIDEYLNKQDPNEVKFFKRIQDQIPLMGSLNPHRKPDPYSEYVIKKIDNRQLKHINDLEQLLVCGENGKLELVEQVEASHGILHIGEKGSGKTLSQNIWLYYNNEKLEKNNIFWVRLDAAKLKQIWDKSTDLNNKRLITPEQYLLGQMVYVFCKHFRKEFTNNYSPLLGKIAESLRSSPINCIKNSSEIETRYEMETHGSNHEKFKFIAHEVRKKDTIYDFLIYLEEAIAIYEGTYKNDGKERKDDSEKHDTSRSYLVDKVLIDNQNNIGKNDTQSLIVWDTIGRILRDFILENGYYLFYIIDGIDNLPFFLKEKRRGYMDKLLNLLYEFPLKKSNSILSKNELLLISLRNTTLETLKQLQYKNYTDTIYFKNINKFHVIRQETNNLAKHIFEKRIDYMLKNTPYKTCFMAKVLQVIKDNHSIPNEKRWNSNFRCFLHNHINLAKLITFKYYFANRPHNFDIQEQIEIYEDDNFFLNGELFVDNEYKRILSNEGGNCFNILGYDETIDHKPEYFIYTRILQLIKSKMDIDSIEIIEIMKIFGISSDDSKNAIDRLISAGMITPHSYRSHKVKFKITTKGEFTLGKFYSNIHYLYYACLDTKLPLEVIENLNVAPNNFSFSGKRKRHYPISCIITGMLFLQYLITENKYILKSRKISSSLKKKNINIDIFNLPISFNELIDSVEKMVKISMRDNYSLNILLKSYNVKN